MEEEIFDIRGQVCPSTLLVALREVNMRIADLRHHETALVFLTDNRDALITIPNAIENMGLSVTVTREDAHYRIRVFRD